MLFRTHRIRRLKTRDEQEVRGYLEVLQMVFDRWADIPFSESVISTLHDRLLRYSEKDIRHKGTYKPVEPFLSERQLKVWEYANSADTFSRKEVIGATGLHPRTVDHTLRKLVDMNRIERFGQGRATRYRLSGENAD